MDRVMRRATHDPAVALAYFEVISMTRRPRSVLRPAVAVRVLADALRSTRSVAAGRRTEGSPLPAGLSR